jgi:hypothetical protein
MMHFKFLARGAIAPMTGFAWQKGVWVAAGGPPRACERGVHVLRPQDLAHWLDEELWTIEIDGSRTEGLDCVVAERGRLVAHVTGWAAGGGMRFAEACRARLGDRVAGATNEHVRTMLERHCWAVGDHVARKNVTMAAYVTAMGISKIEGAATIEERFRRERDWQSSWIARELSLVA